MKFERIKDFEDYIVSNTGDVHSLDRYVFHPRKSKGQFVKGKKLKLQNDKDGYKTVGLHKNGKLYLKKVHRLVAQAFIENPNNYPMINHKNSKRDDNRVGNLEWCDNSINQRHAYRSNGRDNFGENHSHNKLTEKDIVKIICLYINGMNKRRISKIFGVHAQTIGNIFHGKTWSHVTYEFISKMIEAVIISLEQEKQDLYLNEAIYNLQRAKSYINCIKTKRCRRI